jgi:hypothetical protein
VILLSSASWITEITGMRHSAWSPCAHVEKLIQIDPEFKIICDDTIITLHLLAMRLREQKLLVSKGTVQLSWSMPKIIYLKLSTHIVPFMKTEMRAEFV